MITASHHQLFLVWAVGNLNNFRGNRDVILRLGAVVDVPELQLFVTAARGNLLLIRVDCNRSNCSLVPLVFTSHRPIVDVPRLHAAVIPGCEVLSPIRVNRKGIDAFRIGHMNQLIDV